jgi:hypothetical protein
MSKNGARTQGVKGATSREFGYYLISFSTVYGQSRKTCRREINESFLSVVGIHRQCRLMAKVPALSRPSHVIRHWTHTLSLSSPSVLGSRNGDDKSRTVQRTFVLANTTTCVHARVTQTANGRNGQSRTHGPVLTRSESRVVPRSALAPPMYM